MPPEQVFPEWTRSDEESFVRAIEAGEIVHETTEMVSEQECSDVLGSVEAIVASLDRAFGCQLEVNEGDTVAATSSNGSAPVPTELIKEEF